MALDDAVLWEQLLAGLMAAEDREGLASAIDRGRPDILGDRFDAYLVRLAAEEPDAADLVAEVRLLLRACRDAGVELAVEAASSETFQQAAWAEIEPLYLRAQQQEAAFQETGSLAALDQVIDEARSLLDHPKVAAWPLAKLAVETTLGNFLGRRHVATGTVEDLERSGQQLRRVLDLAPSDHPVRPEALLNMSLYRRARFRLSADPADLDQAVALAIEMVSHAPGDPASQARFGSELGVAGYLRYVELGDPADLDRSIAALEQADAAARRLPGGDADRLAAFSTLGLGLWARYRRAGALDDLDRAIEAVETAVAETRVGSPDLPERLSLLGLAGWSRYEHGGDPAELDRVVAVLERSVSVLSPDSTNWPTLVNNLATCLQMRAARTRTRPDLDRGIELLEAAAARSPAGSAERRLLGGSLGSMLWHRRAHGGPPEDLDRAVELLGEANASLAAGSPELAPFGHGLAQALQARAMTGGAPGALTAAVDAYRASCVRGLDARADIVIGAAQGWAEWAVQRRSWKEAAEAYGYALEALDRLFRVQLLRGQKEAWLRRARGLAAPAAFALVADGRPEEAVTALERGRALLLGEALDRGRVDLTRLARQGRPDLVDRYRQAADRLAASAPGGAPAARAAREVLDRVVSEIRQIPGHARFLASPGFEAVAARAAGAPLVYLVASSGGGLALLVSTGKVRSLPLPELTDAAVRDVVSGYLDAQRRWRTGQERSRWEAALASATRWLWDAAMGPLLAALEPVPAAVLLPTGLLALLPLHAAWTADPRAPTGRRHALDHLLLTYAPSGNALGGSRPPDPRTLVAVAGPAGGGAKLLGARHETAVAAAGFEAPIVVDGARTPSGEVPTALAGADALHLACHGQADLDHPLDSWLLLAGEEPLRLRELLHLRLQARLAVLSACESGIPGADLPDEVVGLPTGLLEAGVAAVIASLWPVDDRPTLLLMVGFYQRWRRHGMAPAQALRQAQRWLRDATGAELRAQFERSLGREPDPWLPRQVAQACYEEVVLLPPDTRGFAGLTDWAAFSFMGS
jgi:tetratricopeptide (TPR) repeat protein